MEEASHVSLHLGATTSQAGSIYQPILWSPEPGNAA